MNLILLPFFAIYAAIASYIVYKKHKQSEALLHRLATSDAAWDPDNIQRRVAEIFFKVQEAWMARDQSIARKFMSERLYEKHKIQTDQMLAEHPKECP